MHPSELFNQGIDVTKMGLESPEISEYQKFADEIRAKVDEELSDPNLIDDRPISYVEMLKLKHRFDPDWRPQLSPEDEDSLKMKKISWEAYASLLELQFELNPKMEPPLLTKVDWESMQGDKTYWEPFARIAQVLRKIDPTWKPPTEIINRMDFAKVDGFGSAYTALVLLKRDLTPDYQPPSNKALEQEMNDYRNRGWLDSFADFAVLRHQLYPSEPLEFSEELAMCKDQGEWMSYSLLMQLRHEINPELPLDISEDNLAELLATNYGVSFSRLASLKLDILKHQLPPPSDSGVPPLPATKKF